ncbi:SDR family NAD(P)-dependent oxidoreductase [Bacillota bacterium Meth-B3]
MEYDRAYFAGKVCAVTGGASGIGLALCEELLESGADKVVLADFNRENLKKHEARLNEAYPGKVKGIFCNVTIEGDVERMIGETRAFGGGRLDLLFNNAGAGLAGMFTLQPDTLLPKGIAAAEPSTNEDWAKGFALNFYGALYGCRHALPIMIDQGGGQIVNIISGIAFSPMAYQSMYAATKSALNALTLSLRAEYAHLNIRFNSATPGTTSTAIFEGNTPPPEAQSPHQSAQRILNGVARNERLILGDDGDVSGATQCFLPDAMAQVYDEIYLGFARQRRSGTLSFIASYAERTPEELAALDALQQLIEMGESGMDEAVLERLRAYWANRPSDTVDEAYYKDKTVAVTGGASGVGLALCEELLAYGAEKVALADYNRGSLEAQVRRLNGLYPGKVMGIPCDVSAEEDVQAMIAAATAFFGGRLDILINCAGVGRSGMFTETPDTAGMIARLKERCDGDGGLDGFVDSQADWERVFAVNFYGALYGCRAALAVMLAQGHGQIVNVISGTAFTPMPYQASYSASKAALNALTLVLRYEYWDAGIRFNSATPGTTATAIFKGLPAPAGAQSPRQSALRILAGVADNERLILGDDADGVSAMIWGNPQVAKRWDQYFEGVAASRRAGNMTAYEPQ